MAMRTNMYGIQKGNRALIARRKINLNSSYSSNNQISASTRNTKKPILHATPPIPEDINNEHKKIHSQSKQKIN